MKPNTTKADRIDAARKIAREAANFLACAQIALEAGDEEEAYVLASSAWIVAQRYEGLYEGMCFDRNGAVVPENLPFEADL